MNHDQAITEAAKALHQKLLTHSAQQAPIIIHDDIFALVITIGRAPRIFTRCPACHNDTLSIHEGHLFCTWITCPNPTLIDTIGERAESQELEPLGPVSLQRNPAPGQSDPAGSAAEAAMILLEIVGVTALATDAKKVRAFARVLKKAEDFIEATQSIFTQPESGGHLSERSDIPEPVTVLPASLRTPPEQGVACHVGKTPSAALDAGVYSATANPPFRGHLEELNGQHLVVTIETYRDLERERNDHKKMRAHWSRLYDSATTKIEKLEDALEKISQATGASTKAKRIARTALGKESKA